MKASRILIAVIVLLLISFMFQGCAQETGRITVVITDTAQNSEQIKVSGAAAEETNTLQPGGNDQAAVLSEQAGKAPILKNGMTLEEIAKFLNQNADDLTEEKGYKLVRENDTYRDYLYKDSGLKLVCYYIEDEDYNCVKYVELDNIHISICGVNSDMNFEEIKNVLGDTETVTLEEGLPGIKTFEIRYKYNGIKLRINSWNEDGNDGVYFSVVDDFLPEYRNIRVTPEQISHYFKLTREELFEELGEGELLSYNKTWVEYPQYGAEFKYDEQNKQLYAIDLGSNYQINDLKQGIRLEDIINELGKKEMETVDTSEDGPLHVLDYKYNNFRICATNLEMEEWQWTWELLSTEFDDIFAVDD